MPTVLGAGIAASDLSVRFKAPFVSQSLNEKLIACVAPGIYRGFVLSASGTSNVAVLADATHSDHVAVYDNSTQVSSRAAVTVRLDGGNFNLSVSSLTVSRTYVLAIFVRFTTSATTVGEFRAYSLTGVDEFTGAAERDELVVLGTFAVDGAGLVQATGVDQRYRTSAGAARTAESEGPIPLVRNSYFAFGVPGLTPSAYGSNPALFWKSFSTGTWAVIDTEATYGDHSLAYSSITGTDTLSLIQYLGVPVNATGTPGIGDHVRVTAIFKRTSAYTLNLKIRFRDDQGNSFDKTIAAPGIPPAVETIDTSFKISDLDPSIVWLDSIHFEGSAAASTANALVVRYAQVWMFAEPNEAGEVNLVPFKDQVGSAAVRNLTLVDVRNSISNFDPANQGHYSYRTDNDGVFSSPRGHDFIGVGISLNGINVVQTTGVVRANSIGVVSSGFSAEALSNSNGGGLGTASTDLQVLMANADEQLVRRRAFTAVFTDGTATVGGDSTDIDEAFDGTFTGGQFLVRQGTYTTSLAAGSLASVSVVGWSALISQSVTTTFTGSKSHLQGLSFSGSVIFSGCTDLHLRQVSFGGVSFSACKRVLWDGGSCTTSQLLITGACEQMTFRNLTISLTTAPLAFVAVTGSEKASILFEDCRITSTGNSAAVGLGTYAGPIVFRRCIFEATDAGTSAYAFAYTGAASSEALSFEDCTFLTASGAGVQLVNSPAQLTRCTIRHTGGSAPTNVAPYFTLGNTTSAIPRMVDCSISFPQGTSASSVMVDLTNRFAVKGLWIDTSDTLRSTTSSNPSFRFQATSASSSRSRVSDLVVECNGSSTAANHYILSFEDVIAENVQLLEVGPPPSALTQHYVHVLRSIVNELVFSGSGVTSGFTMDGIVRVDASSGQARLSGFRNLTAYETDYWVQLREACLENSDIVEFSPNSQTAAILIIDFGCRVVNNRILYGTSAVQSVRNGGASNAVITGNLFVANGSSNITMVEAGSVSLVSGNYVQTDFLGAAAVPTVFTSSSGFIAGNLIENIGSANDPTTSPATTDENQSNRLES